MDGVVNAKLMTTVVENLSVRNFGSYMGVVVCRRIVALCTLRPLPSDERRKTSRTIHISQFYEVAYLCE